MSHVEEEETEETFFSAIGTDVLPQAEGKSFLSIRRRGRCYLCFIVPECSVLL